MKQFITLLRSAFPDLHATVDDIIAEGDRVVASGTWNGTHQGEFLGIPATGRRMSINIVDIVRMADDGMVEHWGITDNLSMLQQLGVISQAGQ